MSQQFHTVPRHAAGVLFISSRGHPPAWPDIVIPPPLIASSQPLPTCVSWRPQRQLNWGPLISSGHLHIQLWVWPVSPETLAYQGLILGWSPVLMTIPPPWASPGVGRQIVSHHAW